MCCPGFLALQAEFYSWAAFGHGLTPELRGYGPPPIGGQKAVLHYAGQKYADAIAAVSRSESRRHACLSCNVTGYYSL